ncbi:hypothetical protein [Streptomyces sp. NPDC020983]|uniref:hypothetical protein n=1 Tax=Streptomyces sp. NPDC020983 TaxID=3365106 RepID=UPI00379F8109
MRARRGRRAARAGRGAPRPGAGVTAGALGDAVRQAVAEPGYAARAAEVGRRIGAEDAVTPVREALARLA